jgi:hypothetical protein
LKDIPPTLFLQDFNRSYLSRDFYFELAYPLFYITMAPALLLHGLPTPDEEKHFDLSQPTSKKIRARSLSSTSSTEQDSRTATPKVSRLDFSSYDSQDDLVYDIVESMKLSGGCIIRNMIPKDTLNSMASEIRPHLDQVQQADCTSGRNTHEGLC